MSTLQEISQEDFKMHKLGLLHLAPNHKVKVVLLKALRNFQMRLYQQSQKVIETRLVQPVFTYTNKEYLLTIPKYMLYFVDLKRYYQ